MIDEEPIVIKMLDSMLSRKKTVQERLDLNMMLPTSESVKKELRNLLIQEQINRNKEELAQAEYEELYERFQRVVQERQKEDTVVAQKSSNRTQNTFYQALARQNLALVEPEQRKESYESL